jgi:hypothetical protein
MVYRPMAISRKREILLKVREVGRKREYIQRDVSRGKLVRLDTEVMTNCLAALPVAIYLSAAPKGFTNELS